MCTVIGLAVALESGGRWHSPRGKPKHDTRIRQVWRSEPWHEHSSEKCKVMHLTSVNKNFFSPKRSLFGRTEGLLSVLQ